MIAIEVEMAQRALKDVRALLIERQKKEFSTALVQQRLAAKVGGTRRLMEDGEVQMAVHPQFYHYWGQRLGYECWQDKQFVHEFLRDNPECRVKNVSRKIQVGYQPSGKKFHKVYAE